MASVSMDSWFVRWFYTDDAVFAHYVMGARKIPFLSALMSAISSAIILQLGTRLQNKQLTDAFLFIRTLSSTLFSMLAPFLVLFLVFSEELMALLFGGFKASAPIFQIYIGTLLVQFIFVDTVLLALGKSRFVVISSVIQLIVNAILSVVFLYWIGYTGPAWATLISHIVFVLICKKFADTSLSVSVPFSSYFSFKKAAKGSWISLTIPLVWLATKNLLHETLYLFIFLIPVYGLIQFIVHKDERKTLQSVIFANSERKNDS
jgi:O-antigen/teichoic acid export membrane protein